jgi:hypothetical protein
MNAARGLLGYSKPVKDAVTTTILGCFFHRALTFPMATTLQTPVANAMRSNFAAGEPAGRNEGRRRPRVGKGSRR